MTSETRGTLWLMVRELGGGVLLLAACAVGLAVVGIGGAYGWQVVASRLAELVP